MEQKVESNGVIEPISQENIDLKEALNDARNKHPSSSWSWDEAEIIVGKYEHFAALAMNRIKEQDERIKRLENVIRLKEIRLGDYVDEIVSLNKKVSEEHDRGFKAGCDGCYKERSDRIANLEDIIKRARESNRIAIEETEDYEAHKMQMMSTDNILSESEVGK